MWRKHDHSICRVSRQHWRSQNSVAETRADSKQKQINVTTRQRRDKQAIEDSRTEDVLEMNFLHQGFRKLSYYRQTDILTYRQMPPKHYHGWSTFIKWLNKAKIPMYCTRRVNRRICRVERKADENANLQWTMIGPSCPNCSLVLCTWPMSSMKPSPLFGTPCSGQSVNWNCRTVRHWPSCINTSRHARVSVAGRTVWSHTRHICALYRDKKAYNKALYELICLLYLLSMHKPAHEGGGSSPSRIALNSLMYISPDPVSNSDFSVEREWRH